LTVDKRQPVIHEDALRDSEFNASLMRVSPDLGSIGIDTSPAGN